MTHMTPVEALFLALGFLTSATILSLVFVGALVYGIQVTTKFVKALLAFSNKYKVKKPHVNDFGGSPMTFSEYEQTKINS